MFKVIKKSNINIINLTPHEVNIMNAGGDVINIPSTGRARMKTTTKIVGEINGIPIEEVIHHSPYGLPEEKENTIFIVSRIVAENLTERRDLFITHDSIRDELGRITGCNKLAQIPIR